MTSAIPIFMILCNPLSLQHYVRSPIPNFTRIGGVLCQGINWYKPLSKVGISLTNSCLLDSSSAYFRDTSSNGLVADSRSQTGGQMVRRKVECDLHSRCSLWIKIQQMQQYADIYSLQNYSIRPRWRGVAVQVVLPVPEAAVTIFNTPDDGCCDTRNM